MCQTNAKHLFIPDQWSQRSWLLHCQHLSFYCGFCGNIIMQLHTTSCLTTGDICLLKSFSFEVWYCTPFTFASQTTSLRLLFSQPNTFTWILWCENWLICCRPILEQNYCNLEQFNGISFNMHTSPWRQTQHDRLKCVCSGGSRNL